MPHDFLDEQWKQDPHPPRSPRRTPRPPRSRRRLGGGLLLALVIVGMLVATAIVVANPREVTPTPIVTAEPAAETEAPTSAAAATSSEDPDAPPPATAAMHEVITRWASRETPEDQSWSQELSGVIAPDASRRIAAMSCLPVDTAPLRVDALTPEGEPTQEGSTWTGDVTVTVTDTAGAQTPVTVRATAAWSEPTSTWVLTGLECLSSGGAL